MTTMEQKVDRLIRIVTGIDARLARVERELSPMYKIAEDGVLTQITGDTLPISRVIPIREGV